MNTPNNRTIKIGETLGRYEEKNSETIQRIDTLLDLIKAIGIDNKEWFEEIKEPKSIYDLKEGDNYYYIVEYEINDGCWVDDKDDKEKRDAGCIFLILQEAEQELEKRKNLAKVKKYMHKNPMDVYLKDLVKDIYDTEQTAINYIKTELGEKID